LHRAAGAAGARAAATLPALASSYDALTGATHQRSN